MPITFSAVAWFEAKPTLEVLCDKDVGPAEVCDLPGIPALLSRYVVVAKDVHFVGPGVWRVELSLVPEEQGPDAAIVARKQ